MTQPAAADQNPNPTDEVAARIEAARKEEKDKLYGDIQRLQNEVNTLKTGSEQAAKLQKERDDLAARLKVLESASTNNGLNVQQVIDETTNLVKKTFQDQLVAMEQRVNVLDSEARTAKVELIKRQIIADANGEIITSLVVGNTEEELRSSAERAKAEFKALKEKITGKQQAPQPGMPVPPVSGPQGAGTPPANHDKPLVDRPGDMKDWRARRQEALAKMRQMYG